MLFCLIYITWSLLSFVLCWQNLRVFFPPFSPFVINMQSAGTYQTAQDLKNCIACYSYFRHSVVWGKPKPSGGKQNLGFSGCKYFWKNFASDFSWTCIFWYSPCPLEAHEAARERRGCVCAGLNVATSTWLHASGGIGFWWVFCTHVYLHFEDAPTPHRRYSTRGDWKDVSSLNKTFCLIQLRKMKKLLVCFK